MQLKKPTIFLASGSPRRLELLKNLDLTIRQEKIPFREDIDHSLSPAQIAEQISYSKARQAIANLQPGEIILTADTIVFRDDTIMVKPQSQKEAIDFLRKLSGTSHTVVTGVTMGTAGAFSTFSDKTKVYFNLISEKEISYYVENYKPYDKAGAYGIQEWIGWAKVLKIEGSFSNVMGLPTHKVHHYLSNLNEE